MDLPRSLRLSEITDSLSPINILHLAGHPTDCAICQDALVDQRCGWQFSGEPAVQLSCRHIFGEHCITAWLIKHTSCPMCRAVVLPFSEAYRLIQRLTHMEVLLETWQRYRVQVMQEMVEKEATNALLFMQRYTDERPPEAEGCLDFIVDNIVERPWLLGDESCAAARYWLKHVREEREVHLQSLASLIYTDLMEYT